MDGLLWPGIVLDDGINIAHKTIVLLPKCKREFEK